MYWKDMRETFFRYGVFFFSCLSGFEQLSCHRRWEEGEVRRSLFAFSSG